MPFRETFKKEWITKDIDREGIRFTEKFGEYLCDLSEGNHNKPRRTGGNALTTSQIRNFFGELKRIQMKSQVNGFNNEMSSFLLMRPKLAYAEARVVSKKKMSRIADFRKVVDKAHAAVETEADFQRFVDFLEATLAFHKSFGGRD